MKFSNLFHVAACGVALLALSTSAHADSGSAYIVTDIAAQYADKNNVPTGSPEVTFQLSGGIGSISFDPSDNPANYTFDSFLGAGSGASNVAYSSSTANLTGGAVAGSTLLGGTYNNQNYGTLFDITGNASELAGQTITITNDDGISLYVNGNDVFPSGDDYRTPADTGGNESTSFASNTTGSYELVYGECCSAPAELKVTLTPTPEPASILLFGSLLGIGTMVYRKRSQKA